MGVMVIAEAGVNHNGKLELAKQLVDMAVRCGADAVKFQTFVAEECVNKHADKVGYQKKNDTRKESQYEMLKRLELSKDNFKELKHYCEAQGIMFLSTPFGSDALTFLMDIDMPIIKLSSTEVTNHPYLREVARYNRPIILSTGMSYLEEVEEALKVLQEEGNNQVTILHCTTNYPTPLSDVNIRAMMTMQQTLQVPIGYSDHTEDEVSALAAVSMGACVIEKHITLDKTMEGPDHKASMEEEAFKKYVEAIRKVEEVLGSAQKKPTETEKTMRQMVRRSIVAKKFIAKGTILTEEMVTYKRPGTGLSPRYLDDIINKKVIRDLLEDEMIQREDIEGDEG